MIALVQYTVVTLNTHKPTTNGVVGL
jgi:hypothetical protein